MMTTQSPSAALRQRRNWMTNPYRMLHLDYHQPPWMRQPVAGQLDARRLFDQLQARMQVWPHGFEMTASVPEWQVEQFASVEREQVKDE